MLLHLGLCFTLLLPFFSLCVFKPDSPLTTGSVDEHETIVTRVGNKNKDDSNFMETLFGFKKAALYTSKLKKMYQNLARKIEVIKNYLSRHAHLINLS